MALNDQERHEVAAELALVGARFIQSAVAIAERKEPAAVITAGHLAEIANQGLEAVQRYASEVTD